MVMDTARLVTQLPFIMALNSAALVLIVIVSISTPFTTLWIYSSHYSLPAIKSMCVEYVCNMWSLFSRPADPSKEPIVITPRNIFLLVNLIIFFLFISIHLQQHAPAANKRLSRKKKQQHAEKLIVNDKRAAPLASESLSSSACAAELRPLQASVESLENVQAPRQIHGKEETFNGQLAHSGAAAAAIVDEASMESLVAEAGPMQESLAAPTTEQIVLQEDGQLRLIERPISSTVDTKGSDAEKIDDGRLRLVESINGSDAEKIVLEEDGRLRLVESINGSDEEQIVLEEDGRLRLINRPLPSPRLTSRPEKSLSDNSYPNRSVNYDSQSQLNIFNYDNIHSLNNNFNNDTNSLDYHHDSPDNHSLNYNNSNLNQVDNGTLTLHSSSDPSLNPTDDDQHSTFTNKSSKRLTIPRSIRVKKSESLDATWTAINHNKGSAIHANDRDHKHLIRQSSRKDFKPIRGGKGVMRDNTYRVRREPSLGQDELNAKVESFIAKFNEQIRIERQQSILSYMQMVDRGA